MFGYVTKLVHGPEGVIPSFVRLEPFKEITDFRWQILAASGQVVEHISFGGAEGKFGRLRGRDSGVLHSDPESHLIQGGAQIVGTIKDDMGQLVREPLCELDLDDICNSIRGIFLDNHVPWLITHEGIDLRLQIGEMTLCATEEKSRIEDLSKPSL
jgi:hypothetical protein